MKMNMLKWKMMSVLKRRFSQLSVGYIHEVEEPDFLIVIYHGGLNKISNKSKRNERNANEAEKIMEELGVIDLIITAHQHQTIVGKDHETVYVQAGQNAEELVHLSIHFKKRTSSYEIENIESKVIDLNDYNEDQDLLNETHYDRKAVEYQMKLYLITNLI